MEYGSYSELLESYYAAKDKAERLRQKSRDLAKTVHNLHERAAVSYTHLGLRVQRSVADADPFLYF